MEEIWKDIPGYEGYYQVSNIGRVKSLPRIIANSGNHANKQSVPGGFITIQRATHGYSFVQFSIARKKSMMLVHRAVMNAFVGINPDMQIDHLNTDKSDNRLENLEYVTSRENCNRMFANQRKSQKKHSKYPGVTKGNNSEKPWRSFIYHDGKQRFLGYFKTEIEASEAYQNKLKEITASKVA